MQRAFLILTAILLGACGSNTTEAEENLPEVGSHPDQVAHPAPGDPQFANNATAGADQGQVEGMNGATQGPTAGDSDAPYAGDSSN